MSGRGDAAAGRCRKQTGKNLCFCRGFVPAGADDKCGSCRHHLNMHEEEGDGSAQPVAPVIAGGSGDGLGVFRGGLVGVGGSGGGTGPSTSGGGIAAQALHEVNGLFAANRNGTKRARVGYSPSAGAGSGPSPAAGRGGNRPGRPTTLVDSLSIPDNPMDPTWPPGTPTAMGTSFGRRRTTEGFIGQVTMFCLSTNSAAQVVPSQKRSAPYISMKNAGLIKEVVVTVDSPDELRRLTRECFPVFERVVPQYRGLSVGGVANVIIATLAGEEEIRFATCVQRTDRSGRTSKVIVCPLLDNIRIISHSEVAFTVVSPSASRGTGRPTATGNNGQLAITDSAAASTFSVNSYSTPSASSSDSSNTTSPITLVTPAGTQPRSLLADRAGSDHAQRGYTTPIIDVPSDSEEDGEEDGDLYELDFDETPRRVILEADPNRLATPAIVSQNLGQVANPWTSVRPHPRNNGGQAVVAVPQGSNVLAPIVPPPPPPSANQALINFVQSAAVGHVPASSAIAEAFGHQQNDPAAVEGNGPVVVAEGLPDMQVVFTMEFGNIDGRSAADDDGEFQMNLILDEFRTIVMQGISETVVINISSNNNGFDDLRNWLKLASMRDLKRKPRFILRPAIDMSGVARSVYQQFWDACELMEDQHGHRFFQSGDSTSMCLPKKDRGEEPAELYKIVGKGMYHCMLHNLKMPDFLLPVVYLLRYGYEASKNIIVNYSHQVARMVAYIDLHFTNHQVVDIDEVPHLAQYLEVEMLHRSLYENMEKRHLTTALVKWELYGSRLAHLALIFDGFDQNSFVEHLIEAEVFRSYLFSIYRVVQNGQEMVNEGFMASNPFEHDNSDKQTHLNWLREYLLGADKAALNKFLKFVNGDSRFPPFPKITIEFYNPTNRAHHLPRGITCYNTLQLNGNNSADPSHKEAYMEQLNLAFSNVLDFAIQ